MAIDGQRSFCRRRVQQDKVLCLDFDRNISTFRRTGVQLLDKFVELKTFFLSLQIIL